MTDDNRERMMTAAMAGGAARHACSSLDRLGAIAHSALRAMARARSGAARALRGRGEPCGAPRTEGSGWDKGRRPAGRRRRGRMAHFGSSPALWEDVAPRRFAAGDGYGDGRSIFFARVKRRASAPSHASCVSAHGRRACRG